MTRPTIALAAAGLLTMAAGACAADDSGADSGANENQLAVVAAFYPLQFVAERVGADQVSVTGLAPPGVEAHDMELTPSQVVEIAEADLVIYLTDFQPAVDDAVAEHARFALDVAEVVPLIETDHGHNDHGHEDEHDDHGHDDHGHDDHGHDDHGHGHGHEDDDDHGHEDGHEEDDDHHGHDHGPEDPHVWLDPDRLATIAAEVAAALASIDPERADVYSARADTLAEDLAALDAEYSAGLADCQRREMVVSHAAFGYLADRYDLRQIAIAGLSPEEEPTPQRLAEVIREAERHGATTIFFEVLVSPRVAEVIAQQVGAETAVLDPIEGLAPGSEEDYFSLMRANLVELRAALACS